MLYSVAVFVWLWYPTLTPPNASRGTVAVQKYEIGVGAILILDEVRQYKALSTSGNSQAQRFGSDYCY